MKARTMVRAKRHRVKERSIYSCSGDVPRGAEVRGGGGVRARRGQRGRAQQRRGRGGRLQRRQHAAPSPRARALPRRLLFRLVDHLTSGINSEVLNYLAISINR